MSHLLPDQRMTIPDPQLSCIGTLQLYHEMGVGALIGIAAGLVLCAGWALWDRL